MVRATRRVSLNGIPLSALLTVLSAILILSLRVMAPAKHDLRPRVKRLVYAINRVWKRGAPRQECNMRVTLALVALFLVIGLTVAEAQRRCSTSCTNRPFGGGSDCTTTCW